MPLRVRSRLVRRDVPLLLGLSLAVWGMASGGRLTWQVGVALLAALVIHILWELRTADANPGEGDAIDESERAAPPVALAKMSFGLGLLVVVLPLLLVYLVWQVLRWRQRRPAGHPPTAAGE